MKYCFGVDIGGTTVKLGLFSEAGAIVEKWEIVTRTENEGAAILPDVAEAINGKLEQHGIEKEQVLGIGVGVPAPVTVDGIVNGSANLGWKYKNAKKELEELTGLTAEFGNDANVAALGEMWKGGGVGYRNMIMVTLGTGVGGGIIINGKILTGENGAGGEIGHMCVNLEETDTCGCGGHGCLEQYASATGIVRMAKQKLEEETRETTLTSYEELTAKDVFDEAKAGDAVASELVDVLCNMLGTAMANIAAVADPEIFVIGGGVSRAGAILVDGIKEHYAAKAFHACAETEISLATLGNDAGMYGCVRLLF